MEKRSTSEAYTQTYDYFDTPMTIEANLQADQDLDKLEQSLSELNEEISALDAELRGLKDKLQLQSSLDNYIQIRIQFDQNKDIEFSSAIVSLNGYELYSINPRSKLWVINPEIPIFEGPLAPGDYTLKSKLGLITVKTRGVSTKVPKYHVYNQKKRF